MELRQLLGAYRIRCVRHRIRTALRLRERDHVAKTLATREEHDQPIHAERDAAVGRRAIAQRLEQKAELRLRLVGSDPECAEYLFLHDGIVKPDRAAAELEPVQHQIVAVTEHLPRVGLDEIDVIVVWTGECVMRGCPPLRFVVELEERWIDDPKELPGVSVPGLRDEPHLLRDVNTEVREHRVHEVRLSELEADEVAFLGADGPVYR